MQILAILTNGGDTCALNASIKSIRDNAYHVGYKKIYGIRRGYQGLVDGSIDDITHREIDVRIGGSCLGSLRVSPTDWNQKKEEYEINEERCHKMAQCLSDYKIDVLMVIGGDGTLQATKMFQDWVHHKVVTQEFRPFEIMGFLKTIDNDIRTFTHFEGIEVSLCPGFPSAVTKIVSCIEDLRVTARTAERAFSVETMGRDAGWLAASTTFGGAEILLVPEHLRYYLRRFFPNKNKIDKEVSDRVMSDLVDQTVSFYQKNRNVLIGVAEGFEPVIDIEAMKKFAETIRDLYGPRKKVGATELVTMLVSPVLEHYFWCLSHLCDQMRRSVDLPRAVKAVMNEANKNDVGRKYSEKVKNAKEHPLKCWNAESKLLETVGLRSRENENVGSKQHASLTQIIAHNSHVSQQTDESSSGKGYKRMSSPMSIPPYKFEIRPHRTDYLPRSGPPSAYDYKLATVLGEKTGQMLLSKEFSSVPALDKVVPYKDLNVNVVKPVHIKEIETLNFISNDYFDPEVCLHVSGRITNFFRTIMTGPDDLEKAIHEYNKENNK